jgi:recombination protein U
MKQKTDKPKKINHGKIFENDFIKSFKDETFTYRFKDSASSWQGGEQSRFTPTNICDFMVYTKGLLWLLELKSHMGKSLPLTCIREKQIAGLLNAFEKGVRAGLIINFREVNRTYYLPIYSVMQFLQEQDRKSIPIDWIESHGELIPQTIKHRGTHQVYMVHYLFED